MEKYDESFWTGVWGQRLLGRKVLEKVLRLPCRGKALEFGVGAAQLQLASRNLEIFFYFHISSQKSLLTLHSVTLFVLVISQKCCLLPVKSLGCSGT